MNLGSFGILSSLMTFDGVIWKTYVHCLASQAHNSWNSGSKEINFSLRGTQQIKTSKGRRFIFHRLFAIMIAYQATRDISQFTCAPCQKLRRKKKTMAMARLEIF